MTDEAMWQKITILAAQQEGQAQRMASLENRTDRMLKEQAVSSAAINARLDEIGGTIQRAAGGLKVTGWLIGLSATSGGLLLVLQYLGGG